MHLVLPGGSGQLGRLLTRHLAAAGHSCVVLSRDPRPQPGAVRVVPWDGATLGPWTHELEGSDGVIHLSGRSVDCRYTAANLATMLRSRVDSTRLVGTAIAACTRPPRVWLQASTATLYAHTFGPAHDEATGRLGGNEPDAPAAWRHSVELAKAWEAALREAPTPQTRRVALRAAMVMSADRGGVFDAFATLCRLGAGRHGDGRQFVSWIHEYDFAAAVAWLLARGTFDGPVNLAAPAPLPNRDFIAALHAALGCRLAVPLPAWLLEAGAFVRRTETELLLKSRRVVPGRLLAAGFTFQFSTWPDAARELVTRWRRPSTSAD